MKLLFILFFLFLTNCELDLFSFDSSESGSNSSFLNSENVEDPMIYCNRFNQHGFDGILMVYYDKEKELFDSNKAHLFLRSVPYEFTHPATNYIQFHSFYVESRREIFNEVPVSVAIIDDTVNALKQTVTAIDHDLLNNMGINIEKLIEKHSFTLQDTDRWQGLTLSVFNIHNKPIKTAKILIPPFLANPETFSQEHNEEIALSKLHPFNNIAPSSNYDFYQKGLNFCKQAPIEVDFPKFKGTKTALPEKSPNDEQETDLSVLSDW